MTSGESTGAGTKAAPPAPMPYKWKAGAPNIYLNHVTGVKLQTWSHIQTTAQRIMAVAHLFEYESLFVI